MSAPPVLEVTGLTTGYAQDCILSGISLRVERGSSLAVLGRNGVGKSTLMLALTGHLRARSGTIALNASDITHAAPFRRARAGMGWVPQERELFASLTVEEHFAISARQGAWTPDRVYDVFPRLKERRRHLGSQLSGGEQQMLAIARALVMNPSLLLLDEPLEGLAPIVVADLAQRIGRLVAERDLAVVIVEQHARFALEIAQDSVILDRGRIAYCGPSAAIRDDIELLDRLVGMRRLRDTA